MPYVEVCAFGVLLPFGLRSFEWTRLVLLALARPARLPSSSVVGQAFLWAYSPSLGAIRAVEKGPSLSV